MRAAVFTETGGPLSIENLEPSPPGPRDVVVQLGASGVCHSDLSLKNGYVGIMPGTCSATRAPARRSRSARRSAKVKKGDHIVASFIPACGICWFCLHDQSHLCDTEFNVMMAMRGKRPDGSQYMTMTGLGTFAEAMTCNESSIVKVETSVPDEQLALIGCGVTTGVGAALNTAGVSPARRSRSSVAAASASRSSRARASPARRASSRSTRSR